MTKMSVNKILVLDGNPKTKSLCRAISEAIVEEHRKAGNKVEFLRLGEMNFDPVLTEGYNVVQPLEPDLERFRQAVLECNALIIVYPTWWGGMPAKLKGVFDRSFISGFAYKYHEKGPFWDKLLKGRCAFLITTMDAPGWWNWFYYRNCGLHQLRWPILWFCGFSPIRTKIIDRVRFRTSEELALMIKKTAQKTLKL
jgi:putative NADPH-quinone reductase